MFATLSSWNEKRKRPTYTAGTENRVKRKVARYSKFKHWPPPPYSLNIWTKFMSITPIKLGRYLEKRGSFW